jgi:hypothetical protein
MLHVKSRAVKNVKRARNIPFSIKAGRHLSLSQLGKLAVRNTAFPISEQPDGFLFQLGKVEGLLRRFTIEIIPYKYDPAAPGGIKYAKHVVGEEDIEGYLKINVGVQKPEDPTFPGPGADNSYWIVNQEGGGGLGASQAYPTPGH